MPITETDIKKYTPKQILKILTKLSVGAWLVIIALLAWKNKAPVSNS